MFLLLSGQLFLKMLTILKKKMITGHSVILCGQSGVIHRLLVPTNTSLMGNRRVTQGDREPHSYETETLR